MLAITGKTETMNAEASTVRSKSSQMTSSGAMAMIGTVWKKTA